MLLNRSVRSGSARARGLCSALGSGPLLPQWGRFGKTQEQIAQLEEEMRKTHAKQQELTMQAAEMAQRTLAMVTRPFQYFTDPDFMKEWIDGSKEDRERHAQMHERLLEGCEVAYRALVQEFTSPQPEFDLYVKSGALDPELARYLSDAVGKYRDCGRRPVIDVESVTSKVSH